MYAAFAGIKGLNLESQKSIFQIQLTDSIDQTF